jgi:3-phenylpropionate/trans-cinnamate dioxygenase ferredoxin subunit
MSEWVDVARVDEFKTGTRHVVDVEDVMIAVFNLEGDFYAIEDICTHDGESLTGAAVEGDEIICPRHGARFNIKTGEALTAPAYEPVNTFAVRIKDGMVQVRDDRWD